MTRFQRLASAVAALATALITGAARPAAAETQASGTAFVVHPEGLLLTCYHVVKDSGRIRVTLGGRTLPALVVGKDEQRDLALLQVNASGLPSLPWADAASVELGEEVRALGFPLASELGSSLKVTRGTISGVEQERGERVFLVDSVVNPGNSGGPLVNDRGQVVGVVVARFVEAAAFGYVVPVTAAAPLLQGVAPETGTQGGKRLEGPALVRTVAPCIARVTAVPLSETGPVPAPFTRAFPTTRPAPAAALPAPSTSLMETNAGASLPGAAGTQRQPVVKVEAPDAAPAHPEPGAASEPAPTLPAGQSMAPLVEKSKSLAPAGTALNLLPGKAAPSQAVRAALPITLPAAATGPDSAEPAKSAPGSNSKGTSVPASANPLPGAVSTKAPMPPALETTTVPPIDVDAALCRIRATDPPKLPQAQPDAEPAEGERSEWTVTNPNAVRLTLYVRGPEKMGLVVEPGKTGKITLRPGKYEVAAELAVDNVSPFDGLQEFAVGTRYRSRFRVEFQ